MVEILMILMTRAFSGQHRRQVLNRVDQAPKLTARNGLESTILNPRDKFSETLCVSAPLRFRESRKRCESPQVTSKLKFAAQATHVCPMIGTNSPQRRRGAESNRSRRLTPQSKEGSKPMEHRRQLLKNVTATLTAAPMFLPRSAC